MVLNTRDPYKQSWLRPIAQFRKLSEQGGLDYLLGELHHYILDLVKLVNGQISLGTGEDSSWAGNLDAQYLIVVTPAAANTRFSVHHGLNRVPVGYDVVRRDKAAVVYDDGDGSWGDDVITLFCDTATTTIKLRLY